MKTISTLAVAIVLMSFVPPLIADAKLVNFEATHRVPGEYYVVLKTEAELVKMPRSGVGAPAVSPEILPRSEATVKSIGEALARSIGAKFGGVVVSPGHMAFIVRDASEREIRSVLAKDPRIAEIYPSIEITED